MLHFQNSILLAHIWHRNPNTTSLHHKRVTLRVATEQSLLSLSYHALATIADHAGGSAGVAPCLQAELLQIYAHAGQHLEQGHLLLRGVVDQGWTCWVALRPLACVDQVEGAAFQCRLAVLIGLLKASVPALECTRQRCALHLEVHPLTEISL